MRWTITLLLTALYIVGCAGPVTRTGTERPSTQPTPGPNTPSASPEVYYVFPDVPRHPAAESHKIIATQRAYMRVVGKTATEVLSWYVSDLPTKGWVVVPTALPTDRVLLSTKDGRYLSLSAIDAPGGFGVIWLHLRSALEVTANEALDIASTAHHSPVPVEWVASYIPEFNSDRYGNATKHPVWMVEGRWEGTIRAVVYVDAITAEPFQIKVIE